MAVFASDHVVTKAAEFLAACAAAAQAAERGFIVTLGVKPTEPAIGYGYIRPGAAIAGGAHKIEAFVEKPDRETAERYVTAGYLWNSGNFFFRADTMLEELQAFEPEIVQAAREAIDKARTDLGFLALDAEAFGKSPKKSIDYAVMERTEEGRRGSRRYRLVGCRELGRGMEAERARRARKLILRRGRRAGFR